VSFLELADISTIKKRVKKKNYRISNNTSARKSSKKAFYRELKYNGGDGGDYKKVYVSEF